MTRAIACVLVASACIAEPATPPTEGVARVWRQRTDLAPLPGQLNAPHLIYDSKRQRVLMYGGTDQFTNPTDALWQLDTAGGRRSASSARAVASWIPRWHTTQRTIAS